MKLYETRKLNVEQLERSKPVYEAPTIRTIVADEIVKALGPAHATTSAGPCFDVITGLPC